MAHPSSDDLVAFAHGKLDGDQLASIESHIETCDQCCSFLKSVPDDGLLGQLRQVQGDTIEGSPGSETMSAAIDGDEAPREGIPAELQSHSRYNVVRTLGSGGMGVVYEAKHRMMDRTVALKVINRALISHEGAVDRFEREVVAAARLSHRNIVTAYDAEQAGELHFLVMEYVDGVSLAELVKKLGPLPIKHACNYAMQAAMGLQHAFEKGMVHRDIKPQNLMRTPAGRIKILDFGLARLANDYEQQASSAALTGEGVTLGTPDFIAPEQARNSRSADIRADIYSLGCTLYYLLTSRPPFPQGTAIEKMLAHCEQTPPAVDTLRSDTPQQLGEIVARMMAKAPGDRFQTPLEAVEALKLFGAKHAPATHEAETQLATPAPTPTLAAPVVAPPQPPREEPTPVDAPGIQDPVPNLDLGLDPLDTKDAHGINLASPTSPDLGRRKTGSANSRTDSLTSLVIRWAALGGGAVLALVLLITVVPYLFPSTPEPAPEPAPSPRPQPELAGGGDPPVDQRPGAGQQPTVGPNDQESQERAGNRQVAGNSGQKRVLLVVPHDGYWYDDYDPVRRTLDEAAANVTIGSSYRGQGSDGLATSHPEDASGGNHQVAIDVAIAEARSMDYDAIIFIGGNTDPLTSTAQVATFRLINEMVRSGKLVTSLCRGNEVLARSGVLRGKPAALSEYVPDAVRLSSGAEWTSEHPYVEAGNIITGRNFRDAAAFAQFLVSKL